MHELQRVADVAQVRGFVERYGLDPVVLNQMVGDDPQSAFVDAALRVDLGRLIQDVRFQQRGDWRLPKSPTAGISDLEHLLLRVSKALFWRRCDV